jgi:hypothetical protein
MIAVSLHASLASWFICGFTGRIKGLEMCFDSLHPLQCSTQLPSGQILAWRFE